MMKNKEKPEKIRKLQRTYDFFKFAVEGATNMEKNEIDQKSILIEDIRPNGITMKVIYTDPEYISMSDQSV